MLVNPIIENTVGEAVVMAMIGKQPEITIMLMLIEVGGLMAAPADLAIEHIPVLDLTGLPIIMLSLTKRTDRLIPEPLLQTDPMVRMPAMQ